MSATPRVRVGVFDNVIAHVSGEVRRRSAARLPRNGTRWRTRHHPLDAAVARAPPASRSTSFHARGSRFQLHSRPPRQRLPSSLVIEGVSASASGCSSNLERRDTSDER